MAFATYMILVGILLGMQSRFTPVDLTSAATTALVLLFIELSVALSALYILNIIPASAIDSVDLLASLGYKYVGYVGCWLRFCWQQLRCAYL